MSAKGGGYQTLPLLVLHDLRVIVSIQSVQASIIYSFSESINESISQLKLILVSGASENNKEMTLGLKSACVGLTARN